ncbi:MAG: metallophosphoesterase family protein [Myxococcota bacterium]|nr:metallophosphoesterase family protein [Myxococcota bacterium]
MIYAVGDIHGQLGKLEALLAKLPLRDDDRLVFLGDYVDRGPDPSGVVDRLIRLGEERPCVFLIGNHESMFLDFIGWAGEDYFAGEAFLSNGGIETLLSYECLELERPKPGRFALPPTHEDFFRKLARWHLEGDYLFVHAGLGRAIRRGDLGYVLRRARVEELLWDRSTLDLPHELGVTLVYGHTPSSDFGVRWNSPFSIGIDTGAAYGGPLTAIRLPDETIFQV